MRAAEAFRVALDALRVQIDAIDEKLVALLNERARVVVQIGKFKQQNNSPIYAPDRERMVLDKVRRLNKGPLPDRCLEAVYRELMSGSFALESAMDELAVALNIDPVELRRGNADRQVGRVPEPALQR